MANLSRKEGSKLQIRRILSSLFRNILSELVK